MQLLSVIIRQNQAQIMMRVWACNVTSKVAAPHVTVIPLRLT